MLLFLRNTRRVCLVAFVASPLVGCQKPKNNANTQPPPLAKPIVNVVGVARIEPQQGLITLYAGAAGRIMTMPVAENEEVIKEQALLTLDAHLEKAQLSQSWSKIETQRAAISAQEISVTTLALNAEKARADYELNQQLYAVKGITRQTLNDSKANAAKLWKDYQKGVAELHQTKSKLNEMRADVAYYNTQVRQKTLTAPYTGTLLEWKVDLGDYVNANTEVAQMAPRGSLIARTEVDELFAERIKMGQKADIRSQASGKIVGTGMVYFTSGFLKKKSLFEDETAQEDRRVREVRIRLNPNADVLINGRVDCIIHLN